MYIFKNILLSLLIIEQYGEKVIYQLRKNSV